MANYGIQDIIIKLDNSGGTPTTITTEVQTINGFDVDSVMEETTAFGSAWKTSKATGLRMVADITLGGLYSETIDAIAIDMPTGPSATSRTFELTYGSTNKSSVETWKKGYRRRPSKALLRYELVLEATGAVTETT